MIRAHLPLLLVSMSMILDDVGSHTHPILERRLVNVTLSMYVSLVFTFPECTLMEETVAMWTLSKLRTAAHLQSFLRHSHDIVRCTLNETRNFGITPGTCSATNLAVATCTYVPGTYVALHRTQWLHQTAVHLQLSTLERQMISSVPLLQQLTLATLLVAALRLMRHVTISGNDTCTSTLRPSSVL